MHTEAPMECPSRTALTPSRFTKISISLLRRVKYWSRLSRLAYLRSQQCRSRGVATTRSRAVRASRRGGDAPHRPRFRSQSRTPARLRQPPVEAREMHQVSVVSDRGGLHE